MGKKPYCLQEDEVTSRGAVGESTSEGESLDSQSVFSQKRTDTQTYFCSLSTIATVKQTIQPKSSVAPLAIISCLLSPLVILDIYHCNWYGKKKVETSGDEM